MLLTLRDRDMALIRQVLRSGYVKIQAGDYVLPDNMGKKSRTVSFMVKTFMKEMDSQSSSLFSIYT